MRLARRKIAIADVGIPRADAGGIDRDHDFIGIQRRYRQRMASNHLRAPEAIDRRGEHGAGHMHRVVN
jgi:hypothetical protein